ncbi:DUF397 domain-containing protein [Streptomyces thioluteus]|uniref:DUF397 domain-containing protein n=1 Tax=Streptomyces thioluteus TaxID=66431 RepID=UPI0031F138A0
MPPLVWQKSTFSANAANCVTLSINHLGHIQLRESDQPEITLRATRTTLRSFLTAMKADRLTMAVR